MESQKEKKKKMLNLATGNRAQHIQSYLFLKYKVLLPQRLPVESQKKKKKNLLNLATGNRAQHIQSYLLK